MTEFINMWKNYVNFSDRTTRRGYWMAFLFYVIALIIVAIIASFTSMILYTLFALAGFLPSLAMGIRRLRDADKPWWHIIIPILNIISLVQPSKPEDEVPVV